MSATDPNWKDKYSRLLDDYERLEQAGKKRIDLLERGVVRSSLAAEGQDPRLDQHLQNLRDTLRSSDSLQLQQVVTDIERYLLGTENQRQERQDMLAAALDQLIGTLLDSSHDSSTRNALKKLQKAVKDSQQFNSALPGWLQQLGELQAGILLQDDSSRESQGGLLSRLLGKGRNGAAGNPQSPDQEQHQDAEPDTGQESGQENEQNQGSQQHGESGSEPASAPSGPQAGGPDTTPLREALLRLLDELPIAAEDSAQADSLRGQLTAPAEWDGFSRTLNQLAELIIRTSSRRQQEFGEYLQQLNSKLNLITDSVSQTRDSYQSSIDSASSLDQHLHSQVSELHEDVQKTNNLADLKQRVDQRLNQFADTLKQHQQQRKEAEHSLLQRLQELSDRVHQVENEAAQLTSQLVEQHEKARRDALTGLPNRAAWDERLSIEYNRMVRKEESLLLVVIDIDHFKRINDNYGHLAGDKVLKILGQRLQKGIRKTDFMARYGGEEFVILLPDTRLEDGIGLINKLREQIADCPFHFKGNPVQITFSAGIGQMHPGEQAPATFARIDEALYAAKQGGRNQVRSAVAAAT
ncbi:MAG: diguanylate cyclase [Gammaproteobacteria bacterium]|nr:diguanylate cyclase [Gammaproteobacteria bacterium]